MWKVLLGVRPLSASSYSSLVSLGGCEAKLYSKIRGDCFRTFRDDQQFWQLVSEEQMSRVLNAFVHKQTKTFYKTPEGKEKGQEKMDQQKGRALAHLTRGGDSHYRM